MPDRPSQVNRVLALLRSQGSAGLNTSHLQEMPVLDGGAPILRLAARIDQLKRQGFAISSRREANRTSTYFLVSDGPVVSAACGTGGMLDEARGSQSAGRSDATSAAASQQPCHTHAAGLFDPSGFEERGGYRDVAA